MDISNEIALELSKLYREATERVDARRLQLQLGELFKDLPKTKLAPIEWKIAA